MLTLLSRPAILLGIVVSLIAVLFPACNNYSILEHIETPGASVSAVSSCTGVCRLFVTQAPFNGNLGGISGADSLCRADAANPAGAGKGSWRAMLAAANRYACSSSNCSISGSAENFNWVLKPMTQYIRPDGTQIGTTNAASIFAGALSAAIQNPGNNVWTGMFATWTTTGPDDRCNDWTTDSANGIYALSGATDNTAIANFHIACTNTHQLYCAEQ